jgi:hypothetical protein
MKQFSHHTTGLSPVLKKTPPTAAQKQVVETEDSKEQPWTLYSSRKKQGHGKPGKLTQQLGTYHALRYSSVVTGTKTEVAAPKKRMGPRHAHWSMRHKWRSIDMCQVLVYATEVLNPLQEMETDGTDPKWLKMSNPLSRDHHYVIHWSPPICGLSMHTKSTGLLPSLNSIWSWIWTYSCKMCTK